MQRALDNCASSDSKRAQEQMRLAEAARGAAEDELRAAQRDAAEAAEAVRRSEWLLERRRAAPASPPRTG